MRHHSAFTARDAKDARECGYKKTVGIEPLPIYAAMSRGHSGHILTVLFLLFPGVLCVPGGQSESGRTLKRAEAGFVNQ